MLTDFRLVRTGGRYFDELAIQDVGDVHRQQSPLDRVLGTSTIVVHARRARRAPFVLHHVRRGSQLAALLEILSADPRATWDPESVRAALAWEPGSIGMYRQAFVGAGIMVIAFIAIAIGLHGRAAAVAYPADDAIYPGGVKRDRAEIARFMEREVLPWARTALAPIVGGDRVRCETCHDESPAAREWQMPSVAALPQPDVTLRGWELYGGGMDAQMRNAIYGYIAKSDNQAKATYMREIVLPGMARLLGRPAYDFTRSYEYNRAHLAFGCYHCHRVQ